jgi:NADH-quinone oxidoreductase subunit H
VGDYLQIGDQRILLQVSQIDGGVLYVLAMTSLAVYAIMIAGWASNNKFSLLGGLRSSAQMVSYELAMGLSVACMFLFYGTTRLDQIVEMQNGSAHLAGLDLYVLPAWGVVSIPGFIAFVLFWVAAMAECNRTPFDLPEGEASSWPATTPSTARSGSHSSSWPSTRT